LRPFQRTGPAGFAYWERQFHGTGSVNFHGTGSAGFQPALWTGIVGFQPTQPLNEPPTKGAKPMHTFKFLIAATLIACGFFLAINLPTAIMFVVAAAIVLFL
jgi:hypothetical protein